MEVTEATREFNALIERFDVATGFRFERETELDRILEACSLVDLDLAFSISQAAWRLGRGVMSWYWQVRGGHTHVRVFMNGGKAGDLCFRNEEFEALQQLRGIVFCEEVPSEA